MQSTIYERAFRELNACQIGTLRALVKHKLVALMKPRQVGKTHLGVWVNREVMRQDSNAQTLFLAKDYPSIIRSTREKFLKLFPSEEFAVSTAGVRHHNVSSEAGRGASYFAGVDRAPDKIRGGTMAFVHWSEVAFSQFQGGSSFDAVHQTVVLPTLSRTLGYYLLESTPFGSNFWKAFWEADNGFLKVKWPLDLCVNLGAITREQVDMMKKSMHPDMFRQEMECEFVTFMGKIYKEYDSARHDAKIPPPESHEKVIVGLDIGYSRSAFCALFGVWRTSIKTGKKRLHIFHQEYEFGLRPEQMARRVFDALRAYDIDVTTPRGRERVACYSDHDEEVIDELRALHVPVDQADKINPFAARLSLKNAFYFDQIEVDPLKCAKLVLEVGAAAWHEKIADEMDERGDPNSGHWDSEAALRYLWRGSKLEQERPEQTPKHLDTGDENERLAWEMRRGARTAKAEKDDDPRPRAGVLKEPEAPKIKGGETFEY